MSQAVLTNVKRLPVLILCVRVGQETQNIIIWRSKGESTLTAGYEFAHNWYDC